MKKRWINIGFTLSIILMIIFSIYMVLIIPNIISDIKIINSQEEYENEIFIVNDYLITTSAPYFHYLKGRIKNTEGYLLVPISSINDRNALEKKYPIKTKLKVFYNSNIICNNYNLSQYDNKIILYQDNYFIHKKRQVQNFFQKDVLEFVILIMLFIFLKKQKKKYFIKENTEIK